MNHSPAIPATPFRHVWLWSLCGLILLGAGCGTTKSRTATEQLLMSDALDRAVAQIDFSELAGQTVFFDTKFIVNTKDPMFIGNQKGLGFVNAEYVTSSLRQQMVAAGLKLQDKIEDADYVVEARLGAVGLDVNEVIYGIPASNPISVASTIMPNVPPVPAIPELSLGRKNISLSAAKVGVFAYDRKNREAVWQAGLSQAVSDARDTWFLGIGPFQQGSIYKDGTQFAGDTLRMSPLAPIRSRHPELEHPDEPHHVDVAEGFDDPLELYSESRTFRRVTDLHLDGAVRPAIAIEPAAPGSSPNSTPTNPPATSTTTPATPNPNPANAPTTAAGPPPSGSPPAAAKPGSTTPTEAAKK